ncbi:MAG: AMP-binding protein, partial [Gemmataceae bacterium]
MRFANLGSVLVYQAQRLGSLPALRYRRSGWYQDLSWQRYAEEVRFAASGLIDLGIGPGDRVGLVGENSPGWLQADMAILTAGAVCITPHANLTTRQILFQLQDSEAVWVLVSNSAQREKIENCRDQLPRLRGVTLLEGSAGDEDASTWDALCQRGRRASPRVQEELSRRDQITSPDSLATIMYTSGTTGNPKGVMLTHGNILSNTQGILAVQPHEPDDLILSWLP